MTKGELMQKVRATIDRRGEEIIALGEAIRRQPRRPNPHLRRQLQHRRPPIPTIRTTSTHCSLAWMPTPPRTKCVARPSQHRPQRQLRMTFLS